MNEHTFDQLLELFCRTNDPDRLTDQAALVLGNPLVLCDTSYHFIARSDVSRVRDKNWLAGVKRRGWSYELVHKVSQLELDYTGREHSTHILEGVSERRRKLGPLCVDGEHVGYYLVLEEFGPLDQVDEACYRRVAALLTKCVAARQAGQLPGGGRDAESVMLDLLGRGFESRSIFLERAAKSQIARTGTWRVFCILPPSLPGDGPDRRELRSVVGQCLPLSWQVFYGDAMVILADLGTGLYRHRESMAAFEAFLTARNLRAGQSDEFSDPYRLRRHYEQALSAARLGRAFEDGRSVVPYEDYKVYDLFARANDPELFDRFSTEAVRRVCDYDRKNGTQLLDTLYHYLGCGCSVQKAAARLYVHRNTVAYRVARVKELFGLDFDDDWGNYLNYTSCLLRRYCDRLEGADRPRGDGV